MRTPRTTATLLALLLATAAVAGVTELIDRAEALLDDYEALEVLIDGCPGGECPEAGQLVADLDALDVDLAALHSDVTACQCSNPTLDDLVAALDGLGAELRSVVGGWSDQG